MAIHEQKRQKKLAKQHSKEKKSKRELARKKQELCSMMGKMRLASRFPILDCKISAFEGLMPYMLQVVLSRSIGGGEIAVATFLLDCGCLGVKDAHGRYCTPGQYNEVLETLGRRQMLIDSTPERARALIEQTVQFAASLGFSPCTDFAKAFALFGDVDASVCTETFPMGDKEGMPTYINGPYEDAAKQRAILAQLAKVASGDFRFVQLMRVNELTAMLSDEYSEEIDELNGEVDDDELQSRRLE
jgi:hypothetical protein